MGMNASPKANKVQTSPEAPFTTFIQLDEVCRSIAVSYSGDFLQSPGCNRGLGFLTE
jgi:hypothetical protein